MFRGDESPPSGMDDMDGVKGRRAKKTFFCLFLPPGGTKRGLYKEFFLYKYAEMNVQRVPNLYIYSFSA